MSRDWSISGPWHNYDFSSAVVKNPVYDRIIRRTVDMLMSEREMVLAKCQIACTHSLLHSSNYGYWRIVRMNIYQQTGAFRVVMRWRWS